MLELSTVLLLLTSLCKLTLKAINLSPLQLIVTDNVKFTSGPELGKKALQLCKNQLKTKISISIRKTSCPCRTDWFVFTLFLPFRQWIGRDGNSGLACQLLPLVFVARLLKELVSFKPYLFSIYESRALEGERKWGKGGQRLRWSSIFKTLKITI